MVTHILSSLIAKKLSVAAGVEARNQSTGKNKLQ
jgi:hypothetical protein